MRDESIEILGRDQFYRAALDLLVSLLQEEGSPQADEILRLSAEEADERSLWEIGFDSALMVELVLWVEELGVFLPDDLPWATLRLADVYSSYTRELVSGDLGRPSPESGI